MNLKYFFYLVLLTISSVLVANSIVISGSRKSPMINYAMLKLNEVLTPLGNDLL